MGSSRMMLSERSQAPAAHGQVVDLVVAGAADVGLGVHGQGHALPGVELRAGHLHEGALGGEVVGERARVVAGVPLAPEPVHHEVHELHERVRVELGGQEPVELAEGAQELRMVVARLDALRAPSRPAGGSSRAAPSTAGSRAGRAASGWVSGFESCTRKATRRPWRLAASRVSAQTGCRSSRPGRLCTSRQSQRM